MVRYHGVSWGLMARARVVSDIGAGGLECRKLSEICRKVSETVRNPQVALFRHHGISRDVEVSTSRDQPRDVLVRARDEAPEWREWKHVGRYSQPPKVEWQRITSPRGSWWHPSATGAHWLSAGSEGSLVLTLARGAWVEHANRAGVALGRAGSRLHKHRALIGDADDLSITACRSYA